jgi:hypothetical protein
MTLGAIVIEVPRHVVRIRCAVKVRRVTLVTIRIMQLVVAIYMARLTRCCNVGTRQREERRAVIKRRWLPHRCTVTLCAIVTEVPRHVVRIRCAVKVRRVTLVAIRVVQLVVPVDMARLARCRNVGTRQREKRCTVIKRRWLPDRCTVTLRAIVTEVARHVVRVRRLLELSRMALIAIRVM